MAEATIVSKVGLRVKKVGPRGESCRGVKGDLADTGGKDELEPSAFSQQMKD